MGKIFKIKIIDKNIKSFKLEATYFELAFENINLENYRTQKFTKNFLREDEFRNDSIFSIYAKSLIGLEGRNYVLLMKPNGKSVLIRTVEEVEVTKEGTRIYFDKIKELEEVRVPSFLKLDNRTKNIKFNKIDSKSITEIESLLDTLIEDGSLERFESFYLTGNRQATASAKGYLEQSYMTHYFIFTGEKYKNIKNIKIEGELEDIEIEYRDEKKDLIQVKVCELPQEEAGFESSRFIKGINGLEGTFDLLKEFGVNINELVYASNTIKQPLPRLTTLLEAGHEINQENSWNDFSKVERSKIIEIIGDKKQDFKEKLKIVRVSPKYLKDTTNNFFPEFEQLNERLGTGNNKGEIYKELSSLFINNSVTREETIDIKEVAYSFFKKQINDETFNRFYEEELWEREVENIINFLENNDLEYRIKSNLNHLYVIEPFLEMVEEYEAINSRLNLLSSKEFLEEYYIRFKESKILGELINLTEDEKNLVYKYFLFKVLQGRFSLKKIEKEFGLEEI